MPTATSCSSSSPAISRIEFRDGLTKVAPGELIVVPAGTEHRPVANGECAILMLDREGEPNTGASPSAYTRETLETI